MLAWMVIKGKVFPHSEPVRVSKKLKFSPRLLPPYSPCPSAFHTHICKSMKWTHYRK